MGLRNGSPWKDISPIRHTRAGSGYLLNILMLSLLIPSLPRDEV